jgi:hypothetical protein
VDLFYDNCRHPVAASSLKSGKSPPDFGSGSFGLLFCRPLLVSWIKNTHQAV